MFRYAKMLKKIKKSKKKCEQNFNFSFHFKIDDIKWQKVAFKEYDFFNNYFLDVLIIFILQL